MPAPYKHLDMTPEYNRIITALTNIRDDIRIIRNRSEDQDGGIVINEVMNGMQKALLAVSMSSAGGGNAEAVRQEIETPTALNGNVGAPAELAGEDAIYSGSEWSRAGQFARFGIEEDIEEERFLIRVDGAFYYEADGGASEDDGENGPIKQVQPYTKGEYIGYKSMDPAIGYSTGEPSGEKNAAGIEDIADITLPNRRWGPKRLEWKTALDIPNPLADLVNPVSGAVQPKSKEQQNLEAINSAVSPESANPLQALGVAAGIELIKTLPDFLSMGSDGTIPEPPEFDFPSGNVPKNMEDFIGEEWDGTIPRHVRFIDSFQSFGYGSATYGNEIGPYAADGWLSGLTKLWKIPNQGKIECVKFTLREDMIVGGGRYVFDDGNGQTDFWRTTIGANGPTQLIHWFSDTPGGPPRTNAYGKPIVVAGQVGTVVPFSQAYDYSFVTGEGPMGLDSSGTVKYFSGYADLRSVLFPVVSKTYFYNVALVSNSSYWEAAGEAPGPGDLVTYVPDPNFWTDPEDYEYIMGSVSRQGRIANGQTLADKKTTLEMFLRETNIRTFSDSTESTVFMSKDDTMEQFIGSNKESYPSYTEQITEWKYTDDTPVERNGQSSPDIGFDSPAPIQGTWKPPYLSRKFPIPTNGKIAVAQFSFGFRANGFSENTAEYTYRFDQNNSKFSLAWTGPEDPLSNAVYDLDLTPIAWMSSEPGGEPQTLVDGVTGKVVRLNCTSSGFSSEYDGQQLLSTTESFPGDRGTFPIIRKNYFLNVAVVSTSTADNLVASGTEPSPEQCESWSVTDPALGYTGNDEQFLLFDLTERATDRSKGVLKG